MERALDQDWDPGTYLHLLSIDWDSLSCVHLDFFISQKEGMHRMLFLL